MPLSAISDRSRAPGSRGIRARSGARREVEAASGGEEIAHRVVEPEERLHVGADDLDGRVGSDGVDDAGQGLLRVAEGALVVGVVRRPHHPVDADAVDQLEPERIDHERGVHVVCASSAATSCSMSWSAMCWSDACRCSASWIAAGTQLMPPSNQPTPQAGVAVEDAAEDVAPEHLAERRHVVHHADQYAVVAAGRGQRRLADVVGHGQAALLDRLPHRVHRRGCCSRSACRRRRRRASAAARRW